MCEFTDTLERVEQKLDALLAKVENKKKPQAGEDLGQITDAVSLPSQPQTGKAFETLRAQLALHGHTLVTLRENTFGVTKNGLTFFAANLDEVRAFAKRIGVLPAGGNHVI